MRTPSIQDKATTVNAFINALLNKVAKITNYEPMTRYLNGNHIQVLYEKLPKTALGKALRIGVTGTKYLDDTPVYGVKDAEMYLEWLISVVQGYEETKEEIKNKAYDQLCRFILILTDATEWKDGYVLAKPYDWMTKLEEFQTDIMNQITGEIRKTSTELETYQYKIDGYTKQLDQLSESIDNKTDELGQKAIELKNIGEKQTLSYEKQLDEVASMLQDVIVWMKKYGSVLENIEKDYHSVTKPKGEEKIN